MRAAWVAGVAGLMIGMTGPAPALALPVAALVTSSAVTLSPPALVHVGRKGHHRHWRHGRGRWSRYAPLYGPAPELNAAQMPAPAPGYAPFAGSSQPVLPSPPATTPNRSAAAPPQGAPGRAGDIPSSVRPSIQWVDPERAAR